MPASDFDYQTRFVAANAWRLAAMQDGSPRSPSFGCFDAKYWRDKTSEFADARYQEAASTLALLSLPDFDFARGEGLLASSDELYRRFQAGLGQWSRMQYADGSFDEWYKGERGFAAAAFTTIAFGLALHFLGERVHSEDRTLAMETLERAGRWLMAHEDLVKTNHSAAGSAALAIAHKVTGQAELGTAARAKMALTLEQQRAQGWFAEVGGLDLGYCSVLLDYVMLYVQFSGDQTPLPAMKKLVAFMAPHIHPDGTIAPEGGICFNGYVSRIGIGLLSAHDETAGALVALFERASPGQAGLLPTLADDLRLARWSYLPLITHLLRGQFRPSAAPLYPTGWTIHSDGALAAFHGRGLDIYFTVAGGGSVRVFRNGVLAIEDMGIEVRDAGKTLIAGYDMSRPIHRDGDILTMEARMGEAGFLFPGFLSRLVLRLGATTAWGSKMLRRGIDWYRMRSSTALNQSATSVVKGSSNIVLRRSLAVEGDIITISDRLAKATGAPPDIELRCAAKVPPELQQSAEGGVITITRRFDLAALA